MYKLILIEPNDLTEEETNHFRNQGVSMDDWDYMIIINEPVESIVNHFYSLKNTETNKEYYYCNNDIFNMVLHSFYESVWYKSKIPFLNNNEYFVGFAYHG